MFLFVFWQFHIVKWLFIYLPRDHRLFFFFFFIIMQFAYSEWKVLHTPWSHVTWFSRVGARRRKKNASQKKKLSFWSWWQNKSESQQRCGFNFFFFFTLSKKIVRRPGIFIHSKLGLKITFKRYAGKEET